MSAPVVVRTEARLLPREPETFPWGVSDAGSVPVKVVMYWDPRDPLAVALTFRTGRDSFVRWVMARDLLANGLLMPAGEGDVHVRPYSVPGAPALGVRLRNHLRKQAWFLFPTSQVSGFLEATYEQVPLGRERVDLGAEWDALRIGGAGELR